MSNCYTQCSTYLAYDTEEERQWLVVELGKATAERRFECGATDKECSCEDGFSEGDSLGFSFKDEELSEWDKEDTGIQSNRAFWIHGEENVLGEELAALVARYQVTFNRSDAWYSYFANTTDRPFVDGFSGFAYFVYRGEVKCLSPFTDIIRLRQELPPLFDFQQTLPYQE